MMFIHFTAIGGQERSTIFISIVQELTQHAFGDNPEDNAADVKVINETETKQNFSNGTGCTDLPWRCGAAGCTNDEPDTLGSASAG
jgi:hypothetical protein